MKGNEYYIGNTDHDWFEFCKANSPLEQVNFWQPSRKKFHALSDGGIFFFRRKAPINKIGGFGILAFSGDATIADCWSSFGISNGVATLDDFIGRVKRYRKGSEIDKNTLIGVKMIVEPVFLDEADWFELPDDWSQNIVTGKGYTADSDAGKRLYRRYVERYSHDHRPSTKFAIDGFGEAPQAGYYIGKSAKVRINQSQFRLAVMAAYDGKCAISGCAIHEALEAAHIRKFSETLDHSIQNGILLRKDIHSLIDQGLMKIARDGRVILSRAFHDNYPDDKFYLPFDGKKITTPKNPDYFPNLDGFQ